MLRHGGFNRYCQNSKLKTPWILSNSRNLILSMPLTSFEYSDTFSSAHLYLSNVHDRLQSGILFLQMLYIFSGSGYLLICVLSTYTDSFSLIIDKKYLSTVNICWQYKYASCCLLCRKQYIIHRQYMLTVTMEFFYVFTPLSFTKHIVFLWQQAFYRQLYMDDYFPTYILCTVKYTWHK